MLIWNLNFPNGADELRERTCEERVGPFQMSIEVTFYKFSPILEPSRCKILSISTPYFQVWVKDKHMIETQK